MQSIRYSGAGAATSWRSNQMVPTGWRYRWSCPWCLASFQLSLHHLLTSTIMKLGSWAVILIQKMREVLGALQKSKMHQKRAQMKSFADASRESAWNRQQYINFWVPCTYICILALICNTHLVCCAWCKRQYFPKSHMCEQLPVIMFQWWLHCLVTYL